MKTIEDTRERELFNILSAIKIISLLFSTILIINQFYLRTHFIDVDNINQVNFLSTIMLVLLLLGVYVIWYFFSIKAFKSKYHKQIQITENFVFIMIFASLIILSNSYESQYKILFIFVIIIATLQLGIKHGMAVAIICSILILSMDLFLAPSSLVNTYFEKDLILVGVFLSTATVLGHYVKIESENLNRKDLHLKRLNFEIEEKDKQRKYIEEVLFNNDICYSLLLKNSRDAVIIHDDYKIIFSNESAAKLFGASDPEELLGRSFLSLISTKEKSYVENKLSKLNLKNTNMINFEECFESHFYETVIVNNTSAKFIYKGKPTILSIFHDITSDKQVEKLQKDVEKNIELLNETREFNRLITEFFSNISHELKTPLNVIYSAVQVLGLPFATLQDYEEKKSKYLKIMKQNCFRLMRLINNLLDLTKLDSGFLKLNLENHNIITVIEEIAQSVVPYLESKKIKFIFDTDTEEKIVAIDPDKIERIILNLLSNAYKFTNPDGEIVVSITDKGDSVLISVKDSGIGIPADKLQIIFERFGQVDKTLRRFHEGSGIGLSLVKSFVEMHGGTIQISSEVGVGSEFKIMLPALEIDGNSIIQTSIYENNIERINIEFSDIYSDFS